MLKFPLSYEKKSEFSVQNVFKNTLFSIGYTNFKRTFHFIILKTS